MTLLNKHERKYSVVPSYILNERKKMKLKNIFRTIIFIISTLCLLSNLAANIKDEGLLKQTQEKIKKVFNSIQHKNNLAPLKLDNISQGMLVVPDYESGLMQPMPNLDTSVKVDIEGMIASTTVDQIYTNDTGEILETIYIFPLPPNSAVRDMEMFIGDRHIKGIVEEKHQARKMYQEAKESGKKTALTEQERPNIFTNSVANIQPNDIIIIRLKLVEKLQYESGSFSYRFPLVVGPRYIPGNTITGYSGSGWAFDTDIVPDASRITPPVIPSGMRTGNDVDISVRLNTGLPIEKIESSTHDILTSDIDKNIHKITLAEKNVIPNKDFILEYKIQSGKEPKAALFTSSHEGEDYFMLLAMPPDQSQEIKSVDKELIFILDISGSMQGGKITQAKSSLIHALNRLQPNDSFNIIAFNNSNTLFKNSPIQATRKNIKKGIKFVNQLNADGGTQAQPALASGFDLKASEDKIKMVVFITDGAVGNENQLFNLVDQKLGKSRLFTVAIGNAPNGYLLEKISEIGKGTFTYITDNDQVENKMTSLFSKIEHPVLTDMQFKLPVESEIYPGKLPDLFKGQPLTVVGKLDKSTKMDAIISGKTSDGHFKLELPLDTKNSKNAPGIPTVWAKSKVKDLMDDLRRGNREAKNEVIAVAKSFKMVTQFTSFIAIENEVTNPSLAYSTRVIPTEMPEGWSYDGVFGKSNHKTFASTNTNLNKTPVGLPGQSNPIFQRYRSMPSGATSYPLTLLLGTIIFSFSLIVRRLI